MKTKRSKTCLAAVVLGCVAGIALAHDDASACDCISSIDRYETIELVPVSTTIDGVTTTAPTGASAALRAKSDVDVTLVRSGGEETFHAR
jgi:hypothetical protein